MPLSQMGILGLPWPDMIQDPRDCLCITEHGPVDRLSLVLGLPSLGLVRLFSPSELHALVWGGAEPGLAHASGFCSCRKLGFYSRAALLQSQKWQRVSKPWGGQEGHMLPNSILASSPGRQQGVGAKTACWKNGDPRHMGKAVRKGGALPGSL